MQPLGNVAAISELDGIDLAATRARLPAIWYSGDDGFVGYSCSIDAGRTVERTPNSMV